MYFANRAQAGRALAGQIAERYQDKPVTVLALSDGGVVVGWEIANKLQCPITMLLTGEIDLPREAVAVAGISQDGSFTYNRAYSVGELEEIVGEYRGVSEEKKLEELHSMSRESGSSNLVNRALIAHRNLVIVSDGLSSGFSLDMAMDFLKPMPYQKLIVATPLASVSAVDRIHILADDIFCLSVVENYISTDHYYDTPKMPEHEAIVAAVSQQVEAWTKRLSSK